MHTDYLARNAERDKIYFEYITKTDGYIGEILDHVEELELTDETTIIFVSDNGFFLGEHGLRDKRYAYEESIRIPLIISNPKFAPGIVDDLVLNMDLAPTILDLAEVPVSNLEAQGKSLLPLLRGEATDWRESFIYEYFPEHIGPDFRFFALRNQQYKLVLYPDRAEWNELYNLSKDPYEVNNLYMDPAFEDLRNQLHQDFDQLAEEIELEL